MLRLALALSDDFCGSTHSNNCSCNSQKKTNMQLAKFKTLGLAILPVALLVGLSGCATLFTGSYENVIIRSEPPGADVTIDGSYKGVTPVTAALKRDNDHNISLHRNGFADQTFRLTRSFNGISLLHYQSHLLGCRLCNGSALEL